MDQGVLQEILRKSGLPAGNEFESAIVAKIYKQIKSYNLPFTCYLLRTFDGRDVDLLLEVPNYFITIEIKSIGRVNRQDIRNLKGLQDFFPKPLRQSFFL
jgi:hypothetical protein